MAYIQPPKTNYDIWGMMPTGFGFDNIKQYSQLNQNFSQFNPLVAEGIANVMSPADTMQQSSIKEKFANYNPFFKGDMKGGAGMSKDPMAYVQAAQDLAQMGMDIHSSSKSNFSMPDHTTYDPSRIGTMTDLNAIYEDSHFNKNQLHKQTGGEATVNIGSKLARGAKDGYNIGGGWGALVGGVIGAGMGIWDVAQKNATYKKDVKRGLYYNDIGNRNYLAARNQGISNIRTNRDYAMNYQRLFNPYANISGLGGSLDKPELMGVTNFNTGGTHENNPYGGVQVGMGSNGKPNLVEEGEVRWNDFIFSKRVKPTDDVLKKYNTYMRGGFESYADLANRILELHKEREDSPFDKAAMRVQMQRLADAQEWQKLAEEAAQNGMEPEEYAAYKEYMAAQGRQMSMGGNIFDEGGPLGDGDIDSRKGKNFRNRPGEDYMPVHGMHTKAYYEANKNGNAWYIEKYLDYLYASVNGNHGLMYDKNGNRILYGETDKNKYTSKMKTILEKDPDAIYYMYYRAKEIEDNLLKGAAMSGSGEHIYNMGYIMSMLGNPKFATEGSKYYNKTEQVSESTPVYSYDPIGTNTVQIAPEEKKETDTTNSNSVLNTIKAEIAGYKPLEETPVQETQTQKTDNVTPFAGSGGGGRGYYAPQYPYTDYSGPEWIEFVKNRDNPDIVRKFTDDYNKANGTNHTPDYILNNLKDHKWGPITDAFLKYGMTPVQEQPAQTNNPEKEQETTTPATTVQDQIHDNLVKKQERYNDLGLSMFDALRLAPLYNNLRNVMEQDSPDYTYSNQLASLYRPQTYRPVGQYMRYQPIDQHYLDTSAEQQRNTMYGLYRNNSMTPAAANYYATLANTLGKSQGAQSYMSSLVQNNQNRNSALQYNNQLDAANENARQQVNNINYQNYTNAMSQSYLAAEQERLAVEQAQEANRQALYENIGRLGRELSDRYYVSKNPSLMYGPMGIYYKYPEEQQNNKA